MTTNRWVCFLVALSIVLGLGLPGVAEEKKEEKKPPLPKLSKEEIADLEGIVVGVSLLTRAHQFYRDLETGLRNTAKKYKIELRIDSAEFDSSRQADQLDNYIVQGVDAILVCPCDSLSIGTSIEKINKREIPVFTADVAAKGGDVTCHIASDNQAGGRFAAQAMGQALGENGGDIVIIDHPAVMSVIDRVKGFDEEITKYPKVRIVGRNPGWGKRDEAMQVMENFLQSVPNLAGVFGINDDSALGALAAIQAAGKAGQIIIVGYDATPEAREKIDQGLIYADAIQFPEKIGTLTMDAIACHFAGQKIPKTIPVECGLYGPKKPEKGGQ
ncbi:MAG: substrate-binding domain-containing protein [bacterium]